MHRRKCYGSDTTLPTFLIVFMYPILHNVIPHCNMWLVGSLVDAMGFITLKIFQSRVCAIRILLLIINGKKHEE